MGLCENTRSWRWQCGAVMGVMLLGISFAQTVSTQATCSAGDASQNITQPQYQDTVISIIEAGFLSPFVQNFLHTVQPNTFPKDFVLDVVQNSGVILSNPEFIKKVLVYEVGFLVCVAIGVMYIVLMPIVGFCLSCCRCCGNCGGKMYQKQTPSINCLRRTLYWSTLMITIIILAGNICMFRSNQALKASVNQGPEEIRNIIGNVYTFLSSVPQQVNDVVNESRKTIEKVTRNLDNIGPQIGANIQLSFNGSLYPALQSVKRLSLEILTTESQLDNLNSSLVQLQSSVDRVQTNISSVKDQLNQTLNNPNCIDCSSLIPELQKLTLDISINEPNLQKIQSAINEMVRVNLSSKISQAEDSLDSIPQRLTNETKDVVKNSKQVLGDINQQISKFSSEIPLSALDNVSSLLSHAQEQVDKYSLQIESFENIRWAVCVALCCVVLLMVVCNLLGLVLGPLGLTPNADPTNRSPTADCGGIFFMMGAGFSFLFSWLFMIVVLVLFLLGGNIYTLICQPWNNGLLLKIVDTPGLIPGLDLGPNVGLKTKINISDLYRDCVKNKPLWTTLHLNELIDLQALLNISRYTGQIQGQFNSTNITLSIDNLLSPELKSQLGNFSANLEDFNTSAVTQQMNSVYLINLNQTADKITNLSKVQTNSNIKQQLSDEATKLRQIQAGIETNIYPQMKNLNSSINTLRLTTRQTNGTVGEVLSSVGAAQDFLNTNTTQIVKTESRRFLDCQLGYFTAFTNWASLTITQEVGRCGPLAGAVQSLDVMFCYSIVESLNAFWFSLGWCLIFFIPSIICSIKLAKYYRRMKHSNGKDDNHILMSHIPRAQMKVI
ncbi:prominin-2 [Nothobranchius furzeri]|uniref:Prominin 2 n=6 Tax=Nothobranchius TaxID=28779 RepID=A0A1A8AU44_NOTFU|nr:transcript variant X2 [Nothobranchius furzeri]KAF7219958.1 transcript variant X1 [Nothobranchius furzeri]